MLLYLAFAGLAYHLNGLVTDIRINAPTTLPILILDTAPNFLSVFVVSGLALAILKSHLVINSLYCSVGLIIYEILQIQIDERTFDPMDIAATAVGWLSMLVFIFIIEKANYFLIRQCIQK
ncbi:hypothetical protein PN836_005270 [Ningiella sp. W23]|uniref:hypothetical protein n=1 Tax=Ningiella sp. W23 TaxID=3023715 RepID=UPI0037580E8D